VKRRIWKRIKRRILWRCNCWIWICAGI